MRRDKGEKGEKQDREKKDGVELKERGLRRQDAQMQYVKERREIGCERKEVGWREKERNVLGRMLAVYQCLDAPDAWL